MKKYQDYIVDIINKVFKLESDSIDRAIDFILEATLNKNSIYVFGASHAGIITQELFYRAGGMVNINPIFAKELLLDRDPISFTSKMERLEGYGTQIAKSIKFKKDDVLILHSVSGRNPVIIDLVNYAKENKVRTICITNKKYSQSVDSRHSSGKKLFEICDISIDNHGSIGDGQCELKNSKQKVGPTSTVIACTILNSIIVEVCRKLDTMDLEVLPIFYSANLDGGDELNKKVFKQYKEVIHYNL